jgi:hypothetical protein
MSLDAITVAKMDEQQNDLSPLPSPLDGSVYMDTIPVTEMK